MLQALVRTSLRRSPKSFRLQRRGICISQAESKIAERLLKNKTPTQMQAMIRGFATQLTPEQEAELVAKRREMTERAKKMAETQRVATEEKISSLELAEEKVEEEVDEDANRRPGAGDSAEPPWYIKWIRRISGLAILYGVWEYGVKPVLSSETTNRQLVTFLKEVCESPDPAYSLILLRMVFEGYLFTGAEGGTQAQQMFLDIGGGIVLMERCLGMMYYTNENGEEVKYEVEMTNEESDEVKIGALIVLELLCQKKEFRDKMLEDDKFVVGLVELIRTTSNMQIFSFFSNKILFRFLGDEGKFYDQFLELNGFNRLFLRTLDPNPEISQQAMLNMGFFAIEHNDFVKKCASATGGGNSLLAMQQKDELDENVGDNKFRPFSTPLQDTLNRALENLGHLFSQQDKPIEAVKTLETLLLVLPSPSEILYTMIGKEYYKLQQMDDAAKMLQKSVKLNPVQIEAAYILGEYLLKQDDSPATLNKVSQIMKDGVREFRLRARKMKRIEQTLSNAAKSKDKNELKNVKAMNSHEMLEYAKLMEDASTYYGFAVDVLTRNGEWDLANDICYEWSLRCFCDYRPHAKMGALLIQEKRYKEALQVLDKSIGLNPSIPESHYDRARALCYTNKHDEAVESIKTARKAFEKKASSTINQIRYSNNTKGKWDDIEKKAEAEKELRGEQPLALPSSPKVPVPYLKIPKPDIHAKYDPLSDLPKELAILCPKLYMFHGSLLTNNHNFSEPSKLDEKLLENALNGYNILTKMMPSLANGHYCKGEIYEYLGKEVESLTVYNKALICWEDTIKSNIKKSTSKALKMTSLTSKWYHFNCSSWFGWGATTTTPKTTTATTTTTTTTQSLIEQQPQPLNIDKSILAHKEVIAIEHIGELCYKYQQQSPQTQINKQQEHQQQNNADQKNNDEDEDDANKLHTKYTRMCKQQYEVYKLLQSI